MLSIFHTYIHTYKFIYIHSFVRFQMWRWPWRKRKRIHGLQSSRRSSIQTTPETPPPQQRQTCDASLFFPSSSLSRLFSSFPARHRFRRPFTAPLVISQKKSLSPFSPPLLLIASFRYPDYEIYSQTQIKKKTSSKIFVFTHCFFFFAINWVACSSPSQ